jgi:hypothetical protein
MGDYLNNGKKIGTCGRAYYATFESLQEYKHEEEAGAYLNPKNKCSFAFPFPEYDGKKAGDISNFHEGERAEYFFNLPAKSGIHGTITHHLHPKGGWGINVFIDCPYISERVSSNFNKEVETFRLSEVCFLDSGKLGVLVECIYCGQRQVLSEQEIQIAIDYFYDQAVKTKKESEREKYIHPDCINWEYTLKKAENLAKISDRLKNYL